MTVVAVDDTDSREGGLCTTYVATEIADRLRTEGASVQRILLVRLNPAIEHKTRGNAALAVHTTAAPDLAHAVAQSALTASKTDDPNTHPGLVVAGHDPADVEEPVIDFARKALQESCALEDALDLVESQEYRELGWKIGRGRIGALAAIGAWSALADWTYELIAYREPDRWGTPREVDRESVFEAADFGYPVVWDTVDKTEDEMVCVPHTPGPVLYGIRGDDPSMVRTVADRIESEPVERTQRFVTNQGTDVHLRDGTIGQLREGRAYRVSGVVSRPTRTREGGHVFLTVEGENAESSTDSRSIECVAFEPTKRFRNRVRSLRVGDSITVCGEVSDGTLKLEKFAARDLVQTESVTPTCPECGNSMASAGTNQGYRCRDCGTTANEKASRTLERDLELGWYEVPPCARRHVAKPLVRGGFDAPVHPER